MVGAGGFLGAVARYWISGQVHRWSGASFPWGTLTVNLVGCALLGGLIGLAETRLAVTPEARLFLGIGVLGYQFVIKEPPTTVDAMTSFLLGYISGTSEWKKNAEWE